MVVMDVFLLPAGENEPLDRLPCFLRVIVFHLFALSHSFPDVGEEGISRVALTCKDGEGVITSYSIHYTKLYEFPTTDTLPALGAHTEKATPATPPISVRWLPSLRYSSRWVPSPSRWMSKSEIV